MVRGPKAAAVVVSEVERAGLERLAGAHGTAQQVALRARLVLAAAAGGSNSGIARQEGVTADTVRLWRGRWRALRAVALDDLPLAVRLADAPRSGAPARITAEQRCRLQELACAAPATMGRPISQWTSRELADEVISRGIVDHLSPRHAARLLKEGPIAPASGPLLADPLGRSPLRGQGG